jgi:hypothetical protein
MLSGSIALLLSFSLIKKLLAEISCPEVYHGHSIPSNRVGGVRLVHIIRGSAGSSCVSLTPPINRLRLYTYPLDQPPNAPVDWSLSPISVVF